MEEERYSFNRKLKLLSFLLMILGLLGLSFGFITAPKNIQEAREIMSHHDHGEDHSDSSKIQKESIDIYSLSIMYESKKEDTEHGLSHDEHVFHQLSNKPWAALYVAAFFFFMISLGTLAFYAINRAAQVGWSPILFRVMEGITAYMLPGGMIVIFILFLSGLHLNHLFIWMDPEVVAHDKIIAAKKGYLNVPFVLARGLFFLAGWSVYRYFSRKFSIAQDKAKDNKNFKRNFQISAGFLVFFIYTESMMSWDWIMSVDPHWFSTLFGWYVFASMAVSGITVIALITIYLQFKGLMKYVNDSHLHDLAKFMFGFSVFWAYLWFSQFMLIWYANIPEEVTYFVTRIEMYPIPFFTMFCLNFIFPFLVLMNSDYKRIPIFIVMAGVIILVGHYMDVYMMIMPATVIDRYGFGIAEFSSILIFLGLFLLLVFYALSKEELLAKGNPMIKESENFHY